MIQESSLQIAPACRALNICRSSYYALQHRTALEDPDEAICKSIHEIALEFPGYGYRRIREQLRRQDMPVNGKKVLRIMREEKILCNRRSFKPKTTNSKHNLPLYPNLTQGLAVTRPNQLWVADITYIHFQVGVAYLATLLDLFGRKCVGWELSRRIDADLAVSALDKAVAQRAPVGIKGLIHHSDRGVQYASQKYVERLNETGIQISMTQTGNPRENAFAESFFKTLKVEEVYLKEYNTFEDAYRNIKRFIEDVYNAKRLHSSIGYKTPNEMEAEVLNIR